MSLSSLNLIGQSVFELESRNKNVDGRTDGRRTHQSNRRVGLHTTRLKLSLEFNFHLNFTKLTEICMYPIQFIPTKFERN